MRNHRASSLKTSLGFFQREKEICEYNLRNTQWMVCIIDQTAFSQRILVAKKLGNLEKDAFFLMIGAQNKVLVLGILRPETHISEVYKLYGPGM